jgi:hypothetical protein
MKSSLPSAAALTRISKSAFAVPGYVALHEAGSAEIPIVQFAFDLVEHGVANPSKVLVPRARPGVNAAEIDMVGAPYEVIDDVPHRTDLAFVNKIEIEFIGSAAAT